MIGLTTDEAGAPVWRPTDVPTDPVIAALMATGAPMQQPALPQAPPVAPAGVPQPQLEAPAPPPLFTPPGGPVRPNDFAAPVDPYTSPLQPLNRPGPDLSTTPATAPQPRDPNVDGPGAPSQVSAPKYGDVAGATGDQQRALTEATAATNAVTNAKLLAATDLANRKADIFAGHARAQGLVDQSFQRAREAARADAEAETAVWLKDIEKKTKEEPAPGRWFESQNGFGQMMYILSLGFGAMAQSKSLKVKNAGLEMITAEMNADMERQRERLAREVDLLKSKGLKIDAKMQQRINDSKDDHTMLAQRLTVIQQAAMERANAPGEASYKAAMAEAAQWAAGQKLEIAGQRVQRSTAERESKLNRDAENSRAWMVDKRTRDIAAAEIQKDYDLAQISASAKVAGAAGEKFKDTRVLHPDITGVRVVDAKTGQPVATAASQTGGLVVSDKVEKEAIQASQTAQDRYALLNRVSKELGKDSDIGALLKRNPQLVSDLQKIGYSMAKENDPRGIVTDKDLASGMESALGGDLNSLPGRIAAGTFSAGQARLKEVIDKSIRDMPARMSNQLGALVDASIPGYEGNVRVDWTPKSVEIDKPSTPTPGQIDATYGIKAPVVAPKNIKELETAQALEKTGVEALPPYRPGIEERVVRTLADFKGVLPEKIAARAEAAKESVKDDPRATLEIEQAKQKEMKKAERGLTEFNQHMRIAYSNKLGYGRTEVTIKGPEMVEIATKLARKYGLTQLSGPEIVDLLKKLDIPTTDVTFNPSGKRESLKFE